MESTSKSNKFQHTLIMVLICLVPIFVFFVLAIAGINVNPIFFFILLFICCAIMFYLMGPMNHTDNSEKNNSTYSVLDDQHNITIPDYLKNVFNPQISYKSDNDLIFEGKLLTDSDSAYKETNAHLKNSGKKALLQEDDSGRNFLIITDDFSNLQNDKKQKYWINILLLVLTLITTTWAGAQHQGINLLKDPNKFLIGLPYSVALMLILGCHELGHYFTARWNKMKVTLPYFIPVPFAFGTFGAFIQMKSTAENKKVLFDVGVAGPLAGLIIAIPALIIGLKYSQIIPTIETGSMHAGTNVGSSILLAFIAKITLGRDLLTGHTIIFSPLAFAGWLGLLVTALNLLPIGQLDGGHIAHALFGRKNANIIGMVALFSLVLLGVFVWSGLLTWAIIVYFLAGTKSAPPLNDLSNLNSPRVLLGSIIFIILFLILIPIPHSFYQYLGINCPYI